jgi:hypothetical protein
MMDFSGTREGSTGAARVALYKQATELLLQCVMEGEVRDVTIIASHPALWMKTVTTLTTTEAQEQISVAFKVLAEHGERKI